MLQVIKYVPIIKVRSSGNRDPTARGDKTRFLTLKFKGVFLLKRFLFRRDGHYFMQLLLITPAHKR